MKPIVKIGTVIEPVDGVEYTVTAITAGGVNVESIKGKGHMLREEVEFHVQSELSKVR